MTRDEIVSHPCRVLTGEQREHYFEQGFVALESLLDSAWLQRVRRALAVLVEDVTPDQGPSRVVPGSHKGTIHEHYDRDGRWTGHIREEDLAQVPLDPAVDLVGPAGTVTAHHGGTIHGSGPNRSASSRPILVVGYSSSDARPYTAFSNPSSHYLDVVRGKPARYAHHDAVRLPLPPDWSGGYTSIFADQQCEAPADGDAAADHPQVRDFRLVS